MNTQRLTNAIRNLGFLRKKGAGGKLFYFAFSFVEPIFE